LESEAQLLAPAPFAFIKRVEVKEYWQNVLPRLTIVRFGFEQ
jgi:hypothetical protein